MIATETARRLRDAGLHWQPEPGDRFAVLDRGIDREVFMLSEMTVEVHDIGEHRLFGFNGTTEWAMDSVEERDSVWLPREGQLRALLAGTFRSLGRDGEQWRVDIEVNGTPISIADPDPEEAYAQALLRLLLAGSGSDRQ
ncbi:MAG TPA: hypothetical protein VFD94_04405 [Jatrophihabitans sp.]|nr:hypothetical protein [Jatrophihabitans sp.]